MFILTLLLPLTHTHTPVPTSQAQFRYVKAMDNLEKFIDINYRRKEKKKNNFRRGIEIRLCVPLLMLINHKIIVVIIRHLFPVELSPKLFWV